MKHLIARRDRAERSPRGDPLSVAFLPSAALSPAMDRTADDRADVDVDDLLKVILGLAIVWLLLEILGAALDLTFALLDALPTLIVLAIVALIALRLTDRI